MKILDFILNHRNWHRFFPELEPVARFRYPAPGRGPKQHRITSMSKNTNYLEDFKRKHNLTNEQMKYIGRALQNKQTWLTFLDEFCNSESPDREETDNESTD
jgi:hypothetical protein